MTGERVVVVGAGFGGIAAALRLRALGHEVTLLDRLAELGGRARVVERDGIRIDAGPTVITAPFLLDELFALFGENRADHIALVPVAPFYRIRFEDGRTFDYSGDPDAMRAEIARFAPADVPGYDAMQAHARALYAVGYERYGAASFHSLRRMLAAFPALLRLGGHRSVHALAAKHFADESLRRVFSLQPLLVGGHPFRTSGVYALIGHLERRFGVWHATGGTGALVAALGDLARRAGITVRLGADVERIDTDREAGRATGVLLRGGERITADIVVANADAPALYADLVRKPRPRRWTRRRLDRLAYSMGLFVLCFATRRTYPATAHHTILLGRRYRELLDEVFSDAPMDPAEDPSLYLHRPTATEPGMAPAGMDSFYVLAPVPNLRCPIDWDVAGPRLRDRIVGILDAGELPGLAGTITAETMMTPRDFSADYRSRYGSGFSAAPKLLQSAWFRFHNRSEELRDLYLVGAGTHPGAGLPGVLTSAKVVEGLVAARRPVSRKALSRRTDAAGVMRAGQRPIVAQSMRHS